MGKDTPIYGCAHLNFKRPKELVRLFKEFNGKSLTDSCGFKTKLLVDFALLQRVPDLTQAEPNPHCATFQASQMYQKFLQKYPEFTPKSALVEEVDLDNPDLTSSNSLVISPVQSEMERVIDSGINPELNPIVPKFAELIKAKEDKLGSVQTPLINYVLKKLRRKNRKSKKGDRTDAQKESQQKPSKPSKKFETRATAKQKTESVQTGAQPKQIKQRNQKTSRPEGSNQQQSQVRNNPKNTKSSGINANDTDTVQNQKQVNVPQNVQQQQQQQRQQVQQKKNQPKILQRKPKVEQANTQEASQSATPVQVHPTSMTAGPSVEHKPKQRPKAKAPKKDSIKAMLDAEKAKLDLKPSDAPKSAPPSAPPKRVFTTAAKRQQTQ